MINKGVAIVAYCLRWLAWAFNYLVIWPAATWVMIAALLFCLTETTPGTVAADYLQKAASITDGQQWRWRECSKKTPAERHPPAVHPDKREHLLQEECPEIVSDARGYAAYIDRTLIRGPFFGVWILMGLTYGGVALLLGIRPSLPRRRSGEYTIITSA